MANDEIQHLHISFSTTDDKLLQPADLATIFNEVTTARLTLRRPGIGDGSAVFAIHGDPETNLYNPYGPHADLATSEEMLQSFLQHWNSYGFGIWAITRIQEEQIIGFGGVEHRLWRERNVLNLYYRFTPSAWGQGYGTELAQMAVALARTYLLQWPIVARTRANNIPSMRTAERAGLIRRPDLDTEHVVFALGWAAEDRQEQK